MMNQRRVSFFCLATFSGQFPLFFLLWDLLPLFFYFPVWFLCFATLGYVLLLATFRLVSFVGYFEVGFFCRLLFGQFSLLGYFVVSFLCFATFSVNSLFCLLYSR